MTPLGPVSLFYRSEKHPLEIDAYEKLCLRIAIQVSKDRGGELLDKDHVVLANIIKLPHAAAASHFPEDFAHEGP